MILDLGNELNKLQNNLLYIYQTNNIKSLEKKSLLTFKQNNWLVTFPFNFIREESPDLNIIRKLAVINALYVSYFLREDDVLDEYHLPEKETREILLRYLVENKTKNLAIGQLLNLSGLEIFNFIFDYEEKYYNSLILEKENYNIIINNMFDRANLEPLGNKLLPLNISFVAFCLMNKKSHLISTSEKMLCNYHVAKQLYDDITDLKEDLFMPDKSFLINAIKNTWNIIELNHKAIMEKVFENNLDHKLVEEMIKYLLIAEEHAIDLNFSFFHKEIINLKNKAQNYIRK